MGAGEHSSISAKELKGLNLHYKEISSLMLINLVKPCKYLHCAATKNNAGETQPRVGVRSRGFLSRVLFSEINTTGNFPQGLQKYKNTHFNFPSNTGAFN